MDDEFYPDVELIYIGDQFYDRSKSVMSCIYTTNGQRYDWGFVQRDLRDGKSIAIRPSTDAEYGSYMRKLEETEKQQSSGNGDSK